MDEKLGSSGPLVYTIQELLSAAVTINGLGLPLTTSGKFDKATEDAVKAYQSAVGLDKTGVVDSLTSTVLLRSVFDFELHPPQVVAQPVTRYHCWAASTSSWLDARTGKPKKSTQNLVDMMKKVPGALDPANEGLFTLGWSNLAVRFGMGHDSFGGDKGRKLHQLTPTYLLAKLKRHGHLLMAYNLASGVAHTVVAYGLAITYQADELVPVYSVKIIDPWPAVGQTGLRLRVLNEFKIGGAALVLWPR